ncbi:hypothetical protein NJC40_03385 [Pseudomonas sp. 21LCFQ02]|uniref:hypothetical protein n=1 Tax=Pseudomonas sp. 21LCFQ02 TaxID=2957505 RepID=UPI00209B2086|nr:hypothetical protein [Pseudomonas sp. 21LCFQ02]MCO8166820.1 hypothetical protein [Pseudomonas sp. 21LCFQ02]
MSLIRIFLPVAATASLMMSSAPASAATVTACKFERLPLMLLVARGGMGASDNTLQVGDAKPVPLYIGSSLMNATIGAQSFIFSFRMPISVLVGARDNDTQTFYGDCVSSEV